MKIPNARRLAWHLLVTSLLALAGIGWPLPAAADAAAVADAAGVPATYAHAGAQGAMPPAGWIPLGEARLEAMRGGFALPSGLVVSFGFERLAWVNGELVASIRVSIPDIANMTGPQARELARLQQLQLVQVGPGNVHEGAGGGLVLQNTLDGAQIRVLTTIDAGSNALGLLQAVNFTDALGLSGLGALGTP
ncbi:hypothetical protein WCE39_00830 [Luteimonas sp. MJ174]|uniref:hypothetical protein n=1 Tax=Luteimonas sp. MJ174 TaxID=3129237 RepID=UPI0031BADAB2